MGNSRIPYRNPRNSGTITYLYDALNRLAERIYPNNTSDVFQYDQAGNLVGTTNPNIAYYYSYDLNNRLTGVTSYNLAKIFSVDYQYDITGNRTMMTMKEGTSLPQVIKYSYNQTNKGDGSI
jgi:YD repeat-containing protein